MRWKISQRGHGPGSHAPGGHHSGGHDPRQVDLLAVIALLVVIASASLYFTHDYRKPSSTAFIVPSQSVRW